LTRKNICTLEYVKFSESREQCKNLTTTPRNQRAGKNRKSAKALNSILLSKIPQKYSYYMEFQ